MLFVSELGGKYELGLIVLLSHFLLSPADAFICATTLCFSILINQQLKLTLQEPRPFFRQAGAPNTPCDDLEYGNPSGHAIAFTSLSLVFYDGFCNTLDRIGQFNKLKLVLRGVTFGLIGIIVFSRFYFGVHSID